MKKYAYCFVSVSPVRAENKDKAEIVTQLLFGELIEVLEINENWTKIITFFDNYEGWIDTKHFHSISEKEFKRWSDGLSYQYNLLDVIKTPWGNQIIYKGSFVPEVTDGKFNIGKDQFEFIEKNEEIIPTSIYEIGLSYLNTPYLWGGKTPFGIDCSGFVQQVFRFYGINLPRDASQQVEHGIEIEFEEILSGDVAFFHNKMGKIIHVGILDGKGNIIHASGHVRIDQICNEGIIHSSSQIKTHILNCIKRF